MTLSDVLKTSGHVDKSVIDWSAEYHRIFGYHVDHFADDAFLRFSDWMVKDVQTSEIFRADHLVEAVIEARLKGDKDARGMKDEPPAEDDGDKKKKKKKSVKSVAVKLEDEVVAEYESLLAQVRRIRTRDEQYSPKVRLTTTLVQSWGT